MPNPIIYSPDEQHNERLDRLFLDLDTWLNTGCPLTNKDVLDYAIDLACMWLDQCELVNPSQNTPV